MLGWKTAIVSGFLQGDPNGREIIEIKTTRGFYQIDTNCWEQGRAPGVQLDASLGTSTGLLNREDSKFLRDIWI
jgi:hypothetical protein